MTSAATRPADQVDDTDEPQAQQRSESMPRHSESPPCAVSDLRRVLLAGWEVLGEQAQEKPPTPLPNVLRPFAKFHPSKLPLERLMAVLDSDESLRQRVCECLSENDCGEVGWLWLTRPTGWDEMVASLLADRRSSNTAKSRVSRAQGVLKGLLHKIEKGDRKARAATKAVREAQADLRDKERSASDADARLEDANAARKRAEAEEQLAAKRKRSADAVVSAARSRLNEALQKEAAVGSNLDAMVGRIVALEGSERVEPEEDPEDIADTSPTSADSGPAAPSNLARRQETLLVVDGYNLAFRLGSDDEALPVTRARLERRLNDYAAARLQYRVMIVWDGNQDPYSARPRFRDGPQVGAAEVRFSPVGSKADDSIVEVCRDPPGGLPVIVVTDDKDLRQRAEAEAANIIGVGTLWEMMEPPAAP